MLAEGLFWLLDNGRPLWEATAAHWSAFLRERAEFITDVIRMVERMDCDEARRLRVLSALKAARGRCQIIMPDLCVRYVDAWRADRVAWRWHVHDICRTLLRKKGARERRSVRGLREILRSLDVSDAAARLHLPGEPLHHDLADFDVPFPVAVGQ